MDGERRCGGSEFQTTGAATEKLCRPSLVVLIRGTNGSPRTAGRPVDVYKKDISQCVENVAEVGWTHRCLSIQRCVAAN